MAMTSRWITNLIELQVVLSQLSSLLGYYLLQLASVDILGVTPQ